MEDHSEHHDHEETSALKRAEDMLLKVDVQVYGDGYFSVPEEAANLLVVEAVNHAAKTYGSSEPERDFYSLKPDVFVEAAEKGAGKGVFVDVEENVRGDDIWYIGHEAVGVVSVHDANGDIGEMLRDNPNVEYAPQSIEWSGITRQEQAFDLLMDADLLADMAEKTRPAFLEREEDKGNEQVFIDPETMKDPALMQQWLDGEVDLSAFNGDDPSSEAANDPDQTKWQDSIKDQPKRGWSKE